MLVGCQLNPRRPEGGNSSHALRAVIEDGTHGPWDASIGNKDVEMTAKLFCDQVYVLGHVGLVGDINLISLACAVRGD